MRHYNLKENFNSHIAVGDNGQGDALLQVQNQFGDQARVKLKKEEVELLIDLLHEALKKIQ